MLLEILDDSVMGNSAENDIGDRWSENDA